MKFKFEKEHIAILFILLFGLIAIGLQQSFVGMYYDDFGNASLSYGFTVPGVDGTNYTIRQLLQWAKSCYMNWGGRILYAVVFIIPLLKNGISAFMNVQSVVMILISAVSYHIICHYTSKKYAVFGLLLLYIFYGLIGRSIHVHGTYWASASVLYVWPLLPLFLSFYLYMKACDKIKKGEQIAYQKWILPMAVILFFAACSQEQVGLSVLVFFLFYICFDHLKDWKKYIRLDAFVLIISLVSYLILFLSPGNFARLSGNSDFAQLGFFEKLAFNMPRVLDVFFIKDMRIFNYLLLLAMSIMAFYLIKKKTAFSILGLSTLVIAIVYMGLTGGVIKLPFFILNCFYFGFLLNLIILSLAYFYQTKRMTVNALVIAGGASVFCLLYSPAVQERSYIEYLFIVFILLAIVFIDCYRRYSFYSLFRGAAILLFLLIGVRSVGNFIMVMKGYKENEFYLNFNHDRLSAYTLEDGNTIFLAKLQNNTWRAEMPYDSGFEYMDYWYKEYYNIPQGVSFQWGTLDVDVTLEQSGEFYDDGWFGKQGVVTVTSKKIRQLKIRSSVTDQMSGGNELVCRIGDKTTVYTMEPGANEFLLDFSDLESEVVEIYLEAEKTYKPSDLGNSADGRELSMILQISQQ